MAELSQRPTREVVDHALGRADVILPIVPGGALAVLAAEVRALRAELDATRIGLDVETRRADDWQRVADELREDMARAALAARTPQPAERAPDTACRWCGHGPDGHDGCDCACNCAIAPVPAKLTAPLPAVPDGEDAETGRCDWCGVEVPLTSDGYMHAHKRPDDGADCTGSHDASFGHVWRRSAVLDGEHVPARLDAAAEVLDAHGAHWLSECVGRVGEWMRDSTSTCTPEVRAAVAAALARPTGGDAATP